jgi:hypothetical protein
LRYNGNGYWNKVKAGIERNEAAIRIIRRERRRLAIELLPPPGSPPFAYRPAYEAAGWRPIAPWEADQASGLPKFGVPLSRERQKELRKKPKYVGRFRPEKVCQSPREGQDLADYAHTARRLELRGIRDQLRWQRRGGVWQERSRNPLSAEDWHGGKSHFRAHRAWINRGNEGDIPAYSVEVPRLFLDDEELLLLRRILAKSPGRSRGRPPNGDRAMTDAERQQKHRAKWKPAPAASPQQAKLLAPRPRRGVRFSNRG